MKRHLWFRFVNSYLVILLVSLILMSVVSSISFSLFEKDAIQKNALLLDYVKETFDTRLSEISKLSYEVSYNKQLLDLSKSQDSYEINDAVQLTRTLSMLKSTSEIINEISIYFPHSDNIITSTGRFSTRQFYRLYHEDNQQDYNQYRRMLNSKHMLEYVNSTDIPNNKREEYNIYFYHTFSIDSESHAMPVLMIRLDRDKIENMIKSVVRTNSENFTIMDGQNHIIADSGNEKLLEEALNKLNPDPKPMTGNQLSGSLMISQASSQFGDLHYVSISMKSTLLGVMDTCKNILIIGILTILIVDMMIAVYFSNRNERPIRAMISAISQKAQPAEAYTNEYTYLENNIRKIMIENTTISKALENQTEVLKNHFLTRLLQGDMTDFSEYQRLSERYHIDISRKYHCVFVPYTNSVLPQTKISGIDMADHGGSLHTLIGSTVKQLCSSIYGAEIVRLDGICTVWLTVSDKEKDPSKSTEEFCHELIREVNSQYGISLKIASSNIYDNWDQIALSYAEALQTMHSLISHKEVSYLNYASLKKEDQRGRNKSLELLSQYINCLKLQDYENALRMTDALFSAYLPPHLSKDMYMLHRNTMISVIMDAVELVDVIYGRPDFCQCYHRLQSASQKAETLQQAMEQTLQEIINCKHNYEQQDYNRYTNTLLEFINQNYTNPNLGLYMLAEHFEINNTYLSKIFKHEFNIGMLEYINKIRVEKAKEILLNTTQSILMISQAVGYISDITFIRVFKRYEGTTPGRYREGLKEKHTRKGEVIL